MSSSCVVLVSGATVRCMVCGEKSVMRASGVGKCVVCGSMNVKQVCIV